MPPRRGWARTLPRTRTPPAAAAPTPSAGPPSPARKPSGRKLGGCAGRTGAYLRLSLAAMSAVTGQVESGRVVRDAQQAAEQTGMATRRQGLPAPGSQTTADSVRTRAVGSAPQRCHPPPCSHHPSPRPPAARRTATWTRAGSAPPPHPRRPRASSQRAPMPRASSPHREAPRPRDTTAQTSQASSPRPAPPSPGLPSRPHPDRVVSPRPPAARTSSRAVDAARQGCASTARESTTLLPRVAPTEPGLTAPVWH